MNPDQMPVILRETAGHSRPTYYIETPDRPLKVTYGDRKRDTGRRIHGMRVVESTGKDKSKLIAGLGAPYSSRGMVYLPATADGVKAKLRRLRPQEAGLLAAADAAVDEARRALAEAQAARERALAEAFQKGHVITVKELVALADEFEAARAAR